MDELVDQPAWVHILEFKFSQHRAITVTQLSYVHSTSLLAVSSLLQASPWQLGSLLGPQSAVLGLGGWVW